MAIENGSGQNSRFSFKIIYHEQNNYNKTYLRVPLQKPWKRGCIKLELKENVPHFQNFVLCNSVLNVIYSFLTLIFCFKEPLFFKDLLALSTEVLLGFHVTSFSKTQKCQSL